VLKKTLISLYTVVVAVMAIATVVGIITDNKITSNDIYSAWWFTSIWAVLTVISLFYIRRIKRWTVLLLHISFLVILAGALLTHLTSTVGVTHLRKGETIKKYLIKDNKENISEADLPFAIRLDSFAVKYHEGTMAEADFMSYLTIKGKQVIVSMNNIYSESGVRLYQADYDKDKKGSILSVNIDRYGIPVTYTGYALLFFSLIAILIDPKGTYRKLWNSPLLKQGTFIALLLLGFGSKTYAAPHVLPKETAERFGKINILYNNRICPMQTFAIDFTKKISGKSSYQGYTAEQVMTGFLFYDKDWSAEKIIAIKDKSLRETLGLEQKASLNDFFNVEGYRLGTLVQEYYSGKKDKLHDAAMKMDDVLSLIVELQHGDPLKIFPYTYKSKTEWYSPVDRYPSYMEPERQKYMQNIVGMLYQEAQADNFAFINEALDKIHKYQYTYGGSSIPEEYRLKAERIYNAFPFATILFMFNLTLGFLSLVYTIIVLSRKKVTSSATLRIFKHLFPCLLTLSFIALTICLALRWMISGTIPMSNGYETMLVTAWFIMIITLLLYRKAYIIITFGFLISGFLLLVSHINYMNPSITHIMPVLNSPLLSIHVSVIMMSYALLCLTFLCAVTGLLMRRQSEMLMILSKIFLYPALTTLGIGIFIGAIWANVSWGQYWSWDPKETWALITFMVYAVVVHTQSLSAFRKPAYYHIYILLAFCTVIMTYFGVNYVLGGMHSYA